MSRLFPTDLTDDEEAAGFQIEDIANPEGSSNRPLKIKAVVCLLAPSYRLVKNRLSVRDRHHYTLELFCIFKRTPDALPEWTPVDEMSYDDDPHRVVEVATSWMQANKTPWYEAKIPPEGE
jgi:hypothetical protein